MSLYQAIKDKPVEMVSGVAMIAVGLVLTIAGTPTTWQPATGNMLSALGGILLSWSTATIRTSDQARGILRPQLDAINRHLVTVSGQIGRVVREVLGGREDPGSGMALVAQSTRTLYSLVTDIQVMTGGKFESQDIISTVSTLEDLAQKLGSFSAVATSGGKEIESTKQQKVLEQIREAVESLQMQIPPVGLETAAQTVLESIKCPECTNVFGWYVATRTGASASPSCPVCRKRFHAHRGNDGKIFSRKWARPEVADLNCPNCSNDISVLLPREGSLRSRFCLVCYSKIEITDVGEIASSVKTTPLEASQAGEENGRTILSCPSCQNEHRAFAKIGSSVYAVCPPCDRLLIFKVPPLH